MRPPLTTLSTKRWVAPFYCEAFSLDVKHTAVRTNNLLIKIAPKMIYLNEIRVWEAKSKQIMWESVLGPLDFIPVEELSVNGLRKSHGPPTRVQWKVQMDYGCSIVKSTFCFFYFTVKMTALPHRALLCTNNVNQNSHLRPDSVKNW